ncbi:MAG: 50S ribosomal protein L30e [Candidatus Diapherotrites archaeon]|nr:50S ribosomal protein L30e [Candidatus Diapherotrites archaeon]
MDKVTQEKEIRRTADTGKIAYGFREAEKNLLHGKTKLLILARNIPAHSREKLVHNAQLTGIPVQEYEGSGLELGSVCANPFTCTAISVLDAGKSKILELGSMPAAEKKQKTRKTKKAVKKE